MIYQIENKLYTRIRTPSHKLSCQECDFGSNKNKVNILCNFPDNEIDVSCVDKYNKTHYFKRALKAILKLL